MVTDCCCDPIMLALQAAQNYALDTLTDSCTVVGKGTRTPTDYGYSYSETNKTYACRVNAHKSEREILSGDKVVSTYDTTILLPLSAVVAPQDHVTKDERRYEVIATDAGRTGALLLAVAAKKVE